MNSWTLSPYDQTELDLKVELRSKGDKNEDVGLYFTLDDPKNTVIWPRLSSRPKRVKLLWESTCFEFFGLLSEDGAYEEWNFSPSGDWNHFHFESYRYPKKLKEAATRRPSIHSQKIKGKKEIRISFPRKEWIKINLCSILYDTEGRSHYFAMTHNKNSPPDFHNFENFTPVSVF